MGRMLVVVFLGMGFVAFSGDCNAQQGLIPVKPSYTDAAYTPQKEAGVQDTETFATPTPRDQMYVFWVLGKMLSYPIDKAESFIVSKLKRGADPAVVKPASAPSQPNPFQSVNWREIPPAPPAKPR
ncbi:MAG: hypothetical protein QG577_794 [Thermodesulfobacteriota bacterium]|nr:hypothetical protein [Thermodesulfobacteriota bacterium]